jgi:hypothetical protein
MKVKSGRGSRTVTWASSRGVVALERGGQARGSSRSRPPGALMTGPPLEHAPEALADLAGDRLQRRVADRPEHRS